MADWDLLSGRSGGRHRPEDFEDAGLKLLYQQILYERERTHRVAYALIVEHRHAYRELYAQLGLDLIFDDQHRYCAVRPKREVTARLTLEETLLVLTLRLLYHEQVERGALEDGAATITIEELKAAYEAATKRELPARTGRLEQLLDSMWRFGIARQVDPPAGSAQPFAITIMPGVQDLVGEQFVQLLAAHATAAEPAAVEENPTQ